MSALNVWFGWGSRVLASVGARLVALIVIAAIPVVFMAGTIAWQNYHLAADRALQTALLIRQGQVARNQAVIDGTEQMLGAVAQVPAVQTGDAEACHDFLASVIALDPSRYADMAAFGADGQTRCAASTPRLAATPVWADAAAAPWFAEARDARRFTVSPVRRDPATGLNVLIGAYPVIAEGRFLGEVAVAMRVDWLSTRLAGEDEPTSATWIVDRSLTLRPIGKTSADALPPQAILRRLLGPDQAELQADAVDGAPYAYASVRLTPDLGLLIGYRAVRERQEARDALVGRMAELGLLLLVGVVAVWFGGAVGVVDPISRLSRAVGRWRDGQDFDPGPEEYMPIEVRQLSRIFAEATRSLGQRERQLRTALAQQELLMQEIHHRVKNNLQIVASLLNLQASRIRVPAARAEFQAARDRVRALATLHRHLYAHGELHTINMRSFLTELCGQLFQAMGEREGNRIQLDIEAPELQMTSDQAVPLSLIVTEAVTNAVKYAFPGGRSGHVSVRLTENGESAELVIQDDGVGIPAGRSETETGPRDGIGIQLIRGFARQLGASLTVEEGNGTRYQVVMPLRRSRAEQQESLRSTVAAES